MTNPIANQYTPDQVSPPGETLLDILEERGMAEAELAAQTGVPAETIGTITAGQAVITPEIAVQLERVLAIPARFWLDREWQYQESLDQVKHYTTTIRAKHNPEGTATDGDPADVYCPVLPNASAIQLPIALMLQGALVDKSAYSTYAEEVASYGFVVVVPNHERTITSLDGQPLTGLLADEQQVNDVLAQMKVENADAASPIFNVVDTKTLGLLGHSFGGYAGLAAIQNINDPRVSSGNYTRPPELKAGIFYGTSFQDLSNSETFPVIENQGIPVGLIVGTLDGIADRVKAASTYAKIQDPPKVLITVEGANHYGITNEDNERDSNRPTLNQATATKLIGQWSGLFLRSHLLGDQCAFSYVHKTSDA